MGLKPCDIYPRDLPRTHQRRGKWSYLLLALMTLFPTTCVLAVKMDEQRLMDSLLWDYNTAARPVFNAAQSVTVKFGLTLTQISDVDEVNQVLTINVWLEQEWEDERLVWDPKKYNGLKILRIPCEKIWLPDIVLYNSADDFTTGYMKSKAMVTSTGNVFWPPPAKFRSSCKIDITYFPFDDQVCELKFGSWTYDGFQVDITNRSAKVDLTNYVFSGEWELIDVRIRRTEMYYACCEEPYPDVRFTIIIRRKTLYYLFNIIFPCLWLTILSLLGFWLPPDSGEKITLGITVLLSFSVFMLLIAESMPATSEFVPLIGIYLTVTMAMTSLSIILTVFVLQLHHVGPHQKRVPVWVWTVVVDVLAPLMCLCHISQRYRHYTNRPKTSTSNSMANSKQPSSKEDFNHHVNTKVTSVREAGRRTSEDIRMNTIIRDNAFCDTLGGRSRGNCNGVVLAGSQSTVLQRGFGCSAAHDPAQSDAEKGPRGTGDTLIRGEGFCHNGSGRPTRDVIVALSSSHSSPVSSYHSELHNHTSGKNSNNQFAPSLAMVPAEQEPVWILADCSSNTDYNFRSAEHRRSPGDDVTQGQRALQTAASGKPGFQFVSSASSQNYTRHGQVVDMTPGARVQVQKHGHENSETGRVLPFSRSLSDESGSDTHRDETSKHTHSRNQRTRGNLQTESKGSLETVVTSGTLNKEYETVTDGQSTTFEVAGQLYHATYGGNRFVSQAGRKDRPLHGDCQKERITQHLEVLVSSDHKDDHHQDVVTEWRVVAHVMDRLLFWLFLLVAVVSSVLILIVKPLTKPEKWRGD